MRSGRQYQCEMFDENSHAELLEAAAAHQGPLLISGYDSSLYNDMLRGWHREEITTRSRSGGIRHEILWMNFEPYRQLSFEGILSGENPPEHKPYEEGQAC